MGGRREASGCEPGTAFNAPGSPNFDCLSFLPLRLAIMNIDLSSASSPFANDPVFQVRHARVLPRTPARAER